MSTGFHGTEETENHWKSEFSRELFGFERVLNASLFLTCLGGNVKSTFLRELFEWDDGNDI